MGALGVPCAEVLLFKALGRFGHGTAIFFFLQFSRNFSRSDWTLPDRNAPPPPPAPGVHLRPLRPPQVLGGYYGTKFGQRHISHFLLGVQGPREGTWHTVCKVGTGYNSNELQYLTRHFDRRWHSFDRTCPPAHFDAWDMAADDVPDKWVTPRESLVMEVKGFSFVDTVKFKVGFTVRFPRMLRLRQDKSPHQVAPSLLFSCGGAWSGFAWCLAGGGGDEGKKTFVCLQMGRGPSEGKGPQMRLE